MIVGGLFLVTLYMIVRYAIYLAMPVNNMMDWFFRDCLMSLPRFAGFLCLLFLNRRYWKATRLEMVRGQPRALLIPAILVVLLNAVTLSDSTGPSWPLWTVMIGLLTSMVVALFEEYVFRGVLFGGFRKHFSSLTTVFITTFLFTVYHYQAQPLWGWIYLFLMGLIFGIFRLSGAGLGWLVLWHGLVDTLLFFFPQYGASGPADSDLWAYTGLLVVAIWVYLKSRNSGFSGDT